MEAFEAAFQLTTDAQTDWEQGIYDEARDKFEQAKERLIAFADPTRKVQKIIADLDAQLLLLQKEALARTKLLSTLQTAHTPEAPPADPDVWPALPPRAGGIKKKNTPTAKKADARMPAARGSNDRDKKPVKPGSSADDTEAQQQRNSMIDKYTVTGIYERALVETVLSMMREGTSLLWSDITGLEKPKEIFRQTVILPALMPDFFKGIRRPASAILMFGPPGSGKTLLAKAVATESKSTFFLVQTADLASKWRGDSEKLMKLLFEIARDNSPATIFFDEIDSIGSQRGGDNEHESSRRLKSQLLVEMDGFSKSEEEKILVIGATNFPWLIDEALRRRFEKRVFVGLPEQEARLEMLHKTFDCPLDNKVDLNAVAAALDGYSPADITIMCRQAAIVGITRLTRGMSMEEIQALKDVHMPVTAEDINEAITNVRSSVDPASLVRYEEWFKTFGSA